MLAREREREKRERGEKRGRGGRERADPGRERRQKEKKKSNQCAARTCLVEAQSCKHNAKEAKKRTRAGPKRRKGGRRRRKRREEGKRNPKPDHRKRRNPKTVTRLPISCTESHTNHALRTKQNHIHDKSRRSLRKTLRKKTRRNKNRTPKNKPQKRRTFCRRFRDEKQGFLGPKILPKKPRTPRSEFVAKNSPAKNLRHTELWKIAKTEGRSPEKIPDKNGQHFPLNLRQKSLQNGVAGFVGDFSEQLTLGTALGIRPSVHGI